MSRSSLKSIYQRYFQRTLFALISFIFFLPQQSQAQCTSVSIYDRIVSGYHSTLAVKTDGKIAYWGEYMNNNGNNLLVPKDYSIFGSSSTAIMGTIGGGGVSEPYASPYDQAIFLANDGLYAVGKVGGVLKTDLTSSSNLGKILTPSGGNSYGLPSNIVPDDVASIFATFKTLLIVTKNDRLNGNPRRYGEVWIITQTSKAVEANGDPANNVASSSWKQVMVEVGIPLTNITAARGQVSPIPPFPSTQYYSAFMALSANGDVYTWGNSTYLGDGSDVTARSFAAKMNLSSMSSETPKMIGVTGGTRFVINSTTAYAKNTYYLLSNSGRLYTLGDNSKKQCGDFSTNERKSWVNVKSSISTDFTNINFISVQEHTGGLPCASAITTDGKLYTWGEEDGVMLGRSNPSFDPSRNTFDPGIASGSDGSTAVFAEMGGHTLVYIKVGSDKFCYVGHKSGGSMGDNNPTTTDYVVSFDCTNTPQISICGSVPVAPAPNSSTISASLNSIEANGTSTSTITVQLLNGSGGNLTTSGGVVVITTNAGTISSTIDNYNGTYTAILTSPIASATATLRFTVNGVAASATTNVVFTPTVPPSTPGSITGSANVCPGITGLVYSVNPVANAQTYNWTVPTGWTITAGHGTNSITVSAGAFGQNGNVEVSASNVIGLVTNTSALSTLAVTVSPNFSSGEISVTGERICNFGNPTTTIGNTTSSSGGNGSITYSWRSSADGFIAAIPLATAATYTPPAGLTSTTSYRRYANDGLCNTTPIVSSGTWTVTFLPTFLSGEISSTGETICYNGNPLLIGSTTASSGGDASITYKWQANGVDISNSNSATYDPPTGLTSTTTYTRYAKDGTCNLTFALSSGTYTVTVRPNFSAGTISSTGQTICFNENPVIIGSTIASSGGDALISYKWHANGVEIGSSNSTNYDPPAGLTATTTFTRYAKDGTCNLTYALSLGTWVVVVNALPSPSFIVEPGATACPGIDVNYSTQSGQANYIWTIPGILNTDYTITSGGTTSSNSVTLKWLTTGSKTVTINYSNSNNCTAASATSSIATTVRALNTAGNASSSPTICINTALTNITHLTTGATGISSSGITGTNGLPAGVSASWASNTITISGTPSSSGIFNYSIPLTGGCGVITATGTISVTANNTVTRTSAASSVAQTVCINTAMTPISYSTIGATGATFNNLPAGVTGNWSNNLITISGIPSVAGSALTYTITLTGGCGVISTTGTIAVSANNTATRSSALATETQVVCINTAISNITYATTVATGANVTNLPSGVTSSWSNNILTISGTPTVAGSARTFTVNLTGGCGVFTTTGTIAVTPNNTVTRTSAAATVAQTVCINSAITSITYSTTGATGATFSGLPAGVNGVWSNNTITISGTPSISVAAQTYTVTLVGGCGVISTTGTINVLANNTVTRTSAAGTDAQSACANTAMTPIIYATTVATGATVTNLPSGITGSWSNNVLTISGTPTVVGTALAYTIVLTGGCGVVTTTGTIAVKPKNTIALSSLAGTDNQIKCINSAINNITYNTTGATGANFTGLPNGVTGIWSNDAIVLSGSPSVSGSFNYKISLIGGCAIADKAGDINVTPENTITLFSAATTDSQSICIGNNITTIEYTTVGATGFTITGLPTGVQAVSQSNKIIITGTPSVIGIFNYTISLVGGCGQVNKTGAVIINSLPTGTIAASNNGVICEGSNVTLTATGGNTYEWNLNGNSIAGAVAANYSATVAGLYSVKLISDKGCTSFVQQTATLVINNAPIVGYSFDKYCINTPIVFTNSSTTNLSGPVTMLWDFGDNEISSSTSPTHSFLVEKTYAVKLTITPTNCPLIAKSLSKNIKIEVPPLAVRYPNVFALINTNTKLSARAIGKTYAWSPITGLSNASTISPNFNFTTATNYVIKITNDAGCIINDSLNVLIFDKADFFVPNAFSPNNDGRNDMLKIAAPGIETFQYFRIFNRWGNLVFETSNASIFWDGTFKGMAQPAEVYSWFAEGISASGNKIQRNGQTLILR